MTIEKKLFHEDEGEWIEAHVVIDDGGNLSLTGSQGVIVPEDEARDMAREYWHSFFDDCPESIIDMNRRCGSNCHDSETATDYVLEVDGDLHGLDVWREDDERVYILESCGQITDDLISAFPVLKDIAPWHLNQMNAGCEHQDELGWGRDRDIALDRASATEIQIRVIEDLDRRKVIEDAEREWDKSDRRLRFKTLKALGKGKVLAADAEALESIFGGETPTPKTRKWYQEVRKSFVDGRLRENFKPFRSRVFEECLCAPCPVCGYRYGTAWLRRELPSSIIELVNSL